MSGFSITGIKVIPIIMHPMLWRQVLLGSNLVFLKDMSEDIVRFMNENKITMATIGGHGFGAKVAAATAINHMDRFTGVI